MATVWEKNPSLVERLSALWLEGHSSSQIARELGNGITRNSVIGKIHRLGLCGPTTKRHNRIPGLGPKYIRPTPVKPIIPMDLSEPKPLMMDGKPVTVMNAKSCHCRWPHGEVGTASFSYCGATISHGSFCEYHSGKVYVPPHKKDDAA